MSRLTARALPVGSAGSKAPIELGSECYRAPAPGGRLARARLIDSPPPHGFRAHRLRASGSSLFRSSFPFWRRRLGERRRGSPRLPWRVLCRRQVPTRCALPFSSPPVVRKQSISIPNVSYLYSDLTQLRDIHVLSTY